MIVCRSAAARATKVPAYVLHATELLVLMNEIYLEACSNSVCALLIM